MDYEGFITKSISGINFSRKECHSILECPDEDMLSLLNAAYTVRKKYHGNRVHIQVLTNAKSGYCPEDCHYCSQSKVSKAEIEKYPLLPLEDIVAEAASAKKNNAKRYCMALSGMRHSKREIDALCATIRTIKEEVDISICCSIGFLTKEQAADLKQAGLDRVNHNLNTSERFYPEICTTHTFEERMENLDLCGNAGLGLCSGGIIGQGETKDDIIDFLMSLREVNPESVPLNFLIPIKGTPFENRAKDLTPNYCLKVLCLARFLFPDKDIRIAGGREYHFRSLQPLLLYASNSIFVSGYLTTDGQSPEDAIRMIEDLGFELEYEDAEKEKDIIPA